MLKKVLYIISLILEVGVLVGAWSIHYFAERRLGMVRYLNFKNMTWEGIYPLGTLKIVCLTLTILLAVLLLFFFLKKRRESTWLTAGMVVLTIVLTALYAGYTLGYSSEIMADYYFISVLLMIAAAIQIVRTGAALFLSKVKAEGKKSEK